MFENLHNPVFAAGVVLAAIVIAVILWQVFIAILRCAFGRTKKAANSGEKQYLSTFERSQTEKWDKRHSQ
jgi:ABC-type bacteriocin/lantibiotic exporter with double-glycine peptidase domain